MPVNLEVTMTTEENLDDALQLHRESVTYVSMHQKAYSARETLYSNSFANCLAVVVHDADKMRGCLMHIYPVLAGGVDQQDLFDYVDTHINAALKKFSGSGNIQVFLWKGISYTPQSYNNLEESYADHLAQRYSEDVTVMNRMDADKITIESSILYSPRHGKVYLVSGEHEHLLHEKKMMEKSTYDLPKLRKRMSREPAPQQQASIWMRLWSSVRKPRDSDVPVRAPKRKYSRLIDNV